MHAPYYVWTSLHPVMALSLIVKNIEYIVLLTLIMHEDSKIIMHLKANYMHIAYSIMLQGFYEDDRLNAWVDCKSTTGMNVWGKLFVKVL